MIIQTKLVGYRCESGNANFSWRVPSPFKLKETTPWWIHADQYSNFSNERVPLLGNK